MNNFYNGCCLSVCGHKSNKTGDKSSIKKNETRLNNKAFK